MTTNEKLLSCTASVGQFHDEFAIKGTDFNGEAFSLFLNDEFLSNATEVRAGNTDRGLVRVEVLDQKGELVLIRLPGRTFGNGSTVTVRASDLCECKECATA